MASIYGYLEKDSLTAEYYQKVVDIQENNYSAFGSLGWYRYKTGEYEKSIEASKKALAIKSDELWIKCNLALAYLHTEKIKEAQEEYDKAVKLVKSVEELDKYVLIDLEDAITKNPDLPGAVEIINKMEHIGKFSG